jgi:dGTPase
MMMDIRQVLEQRERENLSEFACHSYDTGGRLRSETPCTLRTAFQVDRDRILHSKSFRRLKYKTQVFLAPEGDHYRTRLTHTLEVSQIARTVARALSLNEDLTEAIALGHDLGHTPFGHAGERVLQRLVPGGFRHVAQSLRVVEVLEKNGQGLNLTAEVRDGIARHSKGGGPLLRPAGAALPATLEGQIVRLADIIAYVNHDLDDALRSGLVVHDELPRELLQILGASHSARINTLVRDLIESSWSGGESPVTLSKEMAQAVADLRSWLSAHVYQAATVHQEFLKAARILEELFGYFAAHREALLEHGGDCRPEDAIEVSVADFIAGMTDRFAINLYRELFLPQPWRGV